jgi:hypothetical protein
MQAISDETLLKMRRIIGHDNGMLSKVTRCPLCPPKADIG